jgi:Choline/ethanolamine kinase
VRLRLPPDGVALLRLPRRARTAIARDGELELGPAVLEIGGRLVPAERGAVRWALGAVPTSARGRLASLAPAAVLGLAAPAAIARPPGSRPLAAWLQAHGSGTSVVAARGTAFLLEGERVRLAAKVGAGLPARRELTEARALAELGPAARAAGADVPEVVEEGELAGRPLLVTTGVEGRPASVLIGERPARRDALAARIAEWLLRWNLATAAETTLSRELLEREVLAPARAVGTLGPELERLARAVEGKPVKLVAAHNDLTTANVLVGRDDRLAVVDWDTAAPRALPLADLFYAVADAEAATRGFADRVAATSEEHERRFKDALGLDDAVADLGFHACWLRHAANESLRDQETRPFLEIARTVAAQRIRMGG